MYTSFSLAVPGQEEAEVSHDVLDATIISSNFWPPIQVCPKNKYCGSPGAKSVTFYLFHPLSLLRLR